MTETADERKSRMGTIAGAEVTSLREQVKRLRLGVTLAIDDHYFGLDGARLDKPDYSVWLKLDDPRHGVHLMHQITSALTDAEFSEIVAGMKAEAAIKVRKVNIIRSVRREVDAE